MTHFGSVRFVSIFLKACVGLPGLTAGNSWIVTHRDRGQVLQRPPWWHGSLRFFVWNVREEKGELVMHRTKRLPGLSRCSLQTSQTTFFISLRDSRFEGCFRNEMLMEPQK